MRKVSTGWCGQHPEYISFKGKEKQKDVNQCVEYAEYIFFHKKGYSSIYWFKNKLEGYIKNIKITI